MDQGRFSVFPHENFVDLFLVQFGWEQCESLYSYGPHVRNNYLFHYIISGKGTPGGAAAGRLRSDLSSAGRTGAS